MRKAAPTEKRISEDAVRLLKIFLERKAEELTAHATRIHVRENSLRDELGERHKETLTEEHVKMAIDGKFAGGDRNAEP
jgi:hypothetical protein